MDLKTQVAGMWAPRLVLENGENYRKWKFYRIFLVSHETFTITYPGLVSSITAGTHLMDCRVGIGTKPRVCERIGTSFSQILTSYVWNTSGGACMDCGVSRAWMTARRSRWTLVSRVPVRLGVLLRRQGRGGRPGSLFQAPFMPMHRHLPHCATISLLPIYRSHVAAWRYLSHVSLTRDVLSTIPVRQSLQERLVTSHACLCVFHSLRWALAPASLPCPGSGW